MTRRRERVSLPSCCRAPIRTRRTGKNELCLATGPRPGGFRGHRGPGVAAGDPLTAMGESEERERLDRAGDGTDGEHADLEADGGQDPDNFDAGIMASQDRMEQYARIGQPATAARRAMACS